MNNWWRKRRMRSCIRGMLYGAQDVNADKVALQFIVDVEVVHKYCSNYKTINGRHFVRLYRTPGIDYEPVGQYGGYIKFRSADGTENPLLQHSALIPRKTLLHDHKGDK